MQIFIKTISGETIPLNVELTNTTVEVKQMIQDKEGIKVDQQRLIYAARSLEHDKTLSYYNIQNDCIVFLVCRLRGGMMHISVRNVEFETVIQLYVNPSDLIKNIKEKIKEKEGIEIDRQRMVFGGRALQDQTTLSYNNMQHGCLVYSV